MTTQEEVLQTARSISKMLYAIKTSPGFNMSRGDMALLERANNTLHDIALDHMEPTTFEPGTKVELIGGTKHYPGTVIETKAFVEASQGGMVTEGYTVVAWDDGYMNTYRTELLRIT